MAPSRSLTPRKRPTQARARATFDAVLEAAASVFVREGYAAGTTNRIAERAGVSIGTLYQYFPNKDALLTALVERHLTEAASLIERLLEGARGPLEESVRRFVTEVIALHEREPELHRVLFENAPHPKSLTDRLASLEDATVDALESLLRLHPEVRVKHPDVAAYLLVQAVEGLSHRFVLHPPRSLKTRQCFIEEVVAMLTAYLAGHSRFLFTARRPHA